MSLFRCEEYFQLALIFSLLIVNDYSPGIILLIDLIQFIHVEFLWITMSLLISITIASTNVNTRNRMQYIIIAKLIFGSLVV